jgi:hypothetical protein
MKNIWIVVSDLYHSWLVTELSVYLDIRNFISRLKTMETYIHTHILLQQYITVLIQTYADGAKSGRHRVDQC